MTKVSININNVCMVINGCYNIETLLRMKVILSKLSCENNKTQNCVLSHLRFSELKGFGLKLSSDEDGEENHIHAVLLHISQNSVLLINTQSKKKRKNLEICP